MRITKSLRIKNVKNQLLTFSYQSKNYNNNKYKMLRNENRMTSYSTDIDRNVTMLKQLNIKKQGTLPTKLSILVVALCSEFM